MIGREVIEVVGRDVYALYQAYIEAALDGERTGFERQLVAPGAAADLDPRRLLPGPRAQGHVRGFLVTYSDVDHLKRLELEAGQREHRLRLVTDSVGVADPLLRPAAQAALRQQAVQRLDRHAAPTTCSVTRCASSCPPDAGRNATATSSGRSPAPTCRWERRERKAAGELRWVRDTLFPDREIGGRIGGAFAGDDGHRGRHRASGTR